MGKLFHGGPEFLSRPEAEWPTLPIGDVATVGVSDVEEVTQESSVAPSFIETLLRKKSDYMSIKRIVAYVLRFVGVIQPSLAMSTDNLSSLPSASEMRFAEDK